MPHDPDPKLQRAKRAAPQPGDPEDSQLPSSDFIQGDEREVIARTRPVKLPSQLDDDEG